MTAVILQRSGNWKEQQAANSRLLRGYAGKGREGFYPFRRSVVQGLLGFNHWKGQQAANSQLLRGYAGRAGRGFTPPVKVMK